MPLPFITGVAVGVAAVIAVSNRKILSSKLGELKDKTLENLESIKDKDIKGELKKVASKGLESSAKGLESVSKTLENASQKLEEKAENLENSSKDESLKTVQNDASISKQDEKPAKKLRARRKTASGPKDEK